ncbi:MAG: nucleoside monophosphate kinase [Patescibacteria group bacterium]
MSDKTHKTIIFIGKSGSGKGTQGKLLMEELEKQTGKKVLYVQSGDEFRKFIKDDTTFTRRKTKDMLEKGKLMPEFIAVHMWTNVFVDHYNGEDHIIVDGTPRKYHEAGVLNSVVDFYNLDKPYVIHLDITKSEAVRRLMARGRMDDTKEDIEERLGWYITDVIPTIEYYKKNPHYRFITIDGERPVGEVHKEILKAVGLAK